MEAKLDSHGNANAALVAHFEGLELLDWASSGAAPKADRRPWAGGEIWRIEAGALSLQRRAPLPRAAGHGQDEPIKLLVQLQGEALLTQAGRQAELRAGQFALVDAAQSFQLRMPGRFSQLLLSVPRAPILARYRGLAWHTACASQHGSAGDQLLLHYVQALAMSPQALTAQQALRSHMAWMELLGGSSMVPDHDRLRPRLMGQAHALMSVHLADPEFGAEDLAQALGVSRRHLDKLFAAEGSTVSQALWEQRLQRAAQQLRASNASHAKRAVPCSITSICHANGFTDSAHFSRAFRRRFGLSPSAWRWAGADVDA